MKVKYNSVDYKNYEDDIQEIDQEFTSENTSYEFIDTSWFDECEYDVISAEYTDDKEIIVSLNHRVADIDEAAEELIRCMEKHGVQITDWDVNGRNVFIFNVDFSQTVSASEDFEEYEDDIKEIARMI